MVLTNAQTSAFFQNATQMAIPVATVLQLQQEGIISVDDLAEFDKTSISQIADNLRRPGGRIPDPTPGAPPGATIPTPPFVFGAKSQQRLNVACNIVRCYNMIGRTITAANMQWTHVLSNFKDLWKAIEDRKDSDDPETPKITKALPIIPWIESFSNHLRRCIGVRMVPLAYVIRDEVTVPAVCPSLKNDQPYSETHGLVEGDMIARASHSSGLYDQDNAKVYDLLEEATRSTKYADSIMPFQKKKNGRAAFLALKSHFAGKDKWESKLKKKELFLHTRKWKGQSNFTLEKCPTS